MSISLNLLTKNELNYVKDCLDSVRDLCSDAVVVDSMSVDGTWDLLKSYDETKKWMRPFQREWPHDFSEQRNFAINQSFGEWILTLDADERLDEASKAVVREAVKDPEVGAYLVEIRNYTYDIAELGYQASVDPKYPWGFVRTELYRLFKKNPAIRYEGIIHERIEPALEREQIKRKTAPIVIHHLGKLKEVDQNSISSRLEFYLDLAQRKLKETPFEAQAHWEVGVILQKQKKFADAEACFLRAHRLSPEVDEFEVYFLMSLYQQNAWPRILKHEFKTERAKFFLAVAQAQSDQTKIASLLSYRDDFKQASLIAFEIALKSQCLSRMPDIRKAAEADFGSTGAVALLEGSWLRHLDQFEKAVEVLQNAKSPMGYQELFICLLKLSRFQDAIDFFEKLPDSEKARVTLDSKKLLQLARLKVS